MQSIDGLAGDDRATGAPATGSSSSTGSSPRSARPRSTSAAATGSGGTTATGPTRCACPPWSARGPSRSLQASTPEADRLAGERRVPGRRRAVRRGRRRALDGRPASSVGERGRATGGACASWSGPGSAVRADPVAAPARGRARRRAASSRASSAPATGWQLVGARRAPPSRSPSSAPAPAWSPRCAPARTRRPGSSPGSTRPGSSARGGALDAERSRDRYAVAGRGRGDAVGCPRRGGGMRSPLAYAPRPGPARATRAPSPRAPTSARSRVVAFVFSNPIVLAGAGAAVAVAGLARGRRARRCAPRRAGARRSAVLDRRRQRDRLPARRHDPRARLARCRCSARSTSAPRRSSRAACWRCGSSSCCCAFAVHSACVDPDRVLRLLRPLARRSALTATLITRLVPLAAADHARLREAAALRGPAAAPVGRAALARRLVAGSLDRAVDVAATLELRGYARGVAAAAPAPGAARRHSWRFAAAGMAIAALGIAAAARRRRRASTPIRRSRIDADAGDARPRRRAAAARRRSRSLGPRSRGAGAVEAAVPDRRSAIAGGFTYRYPGRGRARASRARPRARPGRVRRPRRALGLAASRRCCAPAAGWCRTTTAARWRASSRSAASTSASTGPPSSAASVGLVAQDPETQVVSATVRGELELPLELRGEPPAARARAVEEVDAGAGDRRTCSTGRPTRSPAASCSGSRWPRRWSCGRAWCCSTSRPRSSTRSPATS